MSPKFPTPLQKLESKFLETHQIHLYVKRDDTIHPEISGNKWRKLKYNLEEAKKQNHETLLTFGGAFSNHILAVAAAAREQGLNSIGIIRGDELSPESNPTLRRVSELGMQLKFVRREKYKLRNEPNFQEELISKYGSCYTLPEGGSNALAVKGCTEIIDEIDIDFDYIVTAVGTGGTLAGLACGLNEKQSALGISVLKNVHYLDEKVSRLIQAYAGKPRANWSIDHEGHCGGYGKFDKDLIAFVNQFYSEYKIPLDPIYTGKMTKALFDLIEKKHFPLGTTIVALHTGGLQGILGFNEKYGDLIVL